MAISRQIAGFSPSRADDLRKAVGKKDKVLMASLKDEFIEGCIASGTEAGGRQPLEPLRGGRRLLVQQEPRRLLRAARLPHGLPQGEPPGRVHGLAAVLGDGHEGPRAVLRGRLRRDGPLGAAAGRQREPLRLRRDRRDGDPLRPHRGEGRRRERRGRDHRGARQRAGRSSRSGTSAAESTRPRSTSGRWRASSARAPSTRPAPPASGCSRRCPPRPSQAARRRNDMAAGQESLFGAMNAGGADAAWSNSTRRSACGRWRGRTCWPPRRRRSASTSRATRSRTAASSSRGRSPAASRRWPTGPTTRRSPSGASSARSRTSPPAAASR